MRPVFTFTALLLSSTVLFSAANAFAADGSPAVGEELQYAIDNDGVKVELGSNQTLTLDSNNIVTRDFEIQGTGEGYGIVGSITSSDATVGTPTRITINQVGFADINTDTYEVTLKKDSSGKPTNIWKNDNHPANINVNEDGSLSGTNADGEAEAVSTLTALRIDGDATVTKSVFSQNYVNGAAGAIVATGYGTIKDLVDGSTSDRAASIDVQLRENVFITNMAQQGAGISFITQYAKATDVSNNWFVQNFATASKGGGAAISNNGTVNNMNNNYFIGNVARAYGGAIHVGNATSSTERGSGGSIAGSANLFYDNNASYGAAMYVASGASATLTSSKFSKNATIDTVDQSGSVGSAVSGDGLGGAIYNAINGTVVLNGSTIFEENKAGGSGGAIYNAGDLTLEGSPTFTNNTAGTSGHDIYNSETGVVTLSGIQDDIDTTNGRVTFTKDGGLENLGEWNFTNSKIQLHQGMNTVSGKTGTVNVNNSYIDLGTSGKLQAENVVIGSGSTVQTHVANLSAAQPQNGSIEADKIDVQSNTTLKIYVDGGTLKEGETRTVDVLNATTDSGLTGDFSKIGSNKLYSFKKNGDGSYTIMRTSSAATGGCDDNECATAIGWLDGDNAFEDGSLAQEVYDKLNQLAQDGDCTDEEYRNALDAIAPDVSPLIRSHITEINRRLYSIISNRMYSSMERTGYIYRNKRYYRFPRNDSHLWAQGVYGTSKYDVRKGFDGNDTGIAIGYDAHLNEALRLGVGYSYTQGDYDSIGRETTIDSHTGMFYGEYNPNRFFVNWLATYTRSSFSEDKNVAGIHVDADYDVDAMGLQVMAGQKMGPYVNGNWSTGVFMPEVGFRYLYVKQGNYTDSASQEVKGGKDGALTGILGVQYTIGYALSPNISWYPELRAALTYDIIEPEMDMTVNLMNGSVYQVKEETMDRLGFELGGRIGVDVNRKWEMSLEYEGLFRGDYTSHTGLANVKYKF